MSKSGHGQPVSIPTYTLIDIVVRSKMHTRIPLFQLWCNISVTFSSKLKLIYWVLTFSVGFKLVLAASDRDIGVLFCIANMANSKLDSQGFSGQDGHLPASGAV